MLIGVVVLVSSQPRVLCDPVAPENGFGFKMGGKRTARNRPENL